MVLTSVLGPEYVYNIYSHSLKKILMPILLHTNLYSCENCIVLDLVFESYEQPNHTD